MFFKVLSVFLIYLLKQAHSRLVASSCVLVIYNFNIFHPCAHLRLMHIVQVTTWHLHGNFYNYCSFGVKKVTLTCVIGY